MGAHKVLRNPGTFVLYYTYVAQPLYSLVLCISIHMVFKSFYMHYSLCNVDSNLFLSNSPVMYLLLNRYNYVTLKWVLFTYIDV